MFETLLFALTAFTLIFPRSMGEEFGKIWFELRRGFARGYRDAELKCARIASN